MGWLFIDVQITRKRILGCMRFTTTNLPINMSSNTFEELEYFMDRVRTHLVKRKGYKTENVSFAL